jgi:hypothetical protein
LAPLVAPCNQRLNIDGLQASAAGGLGGHPGVTRQRSPLAQAGPMWLTEIGSRALPSISTPGP